jgi:hypothetical protein
VNGRAWTDDELAMVRELYADVSTKEIAARIGRTATTIYQAAQRLGLRKSAVYLASPAACRLRRGSHPGVATQFKKGIVPHNKGVRRPGWSVGRMRETQFKKGDRLGAAQRNWKPIGTIRADHEGYLRIKVREHRPGEHTGFGNTSVWPLLSRHVWEKHRGPIPAGHAVIFKDGDRSKCEIGNLELISRADLCRRNSIHNLPADLKEVIYLKGSIRATVTKRRKKAA